MKSVSSRLVFLFLFTLLSFFQVPGQDLDTATIKGLVQDQNGGVIPGAAIEVALLKTHSKRNAITDAAGRYRVIQLEPGSYSVRISSSGFAAVDLKDVSTIAGQTLQLDTVLAPATVNAETVVVSTNDAPNIDTHRTVVGTTLTTRETQLLPLASRSVFDLIFTLPGVTEEPLSTRDLAEDRAAPGGEHITVLGEAQDAQPVE